MTASVALGKVSPPNPFGAGPQCETYTLQDDRFAPEYPKGSVIVVDPDRKPKDEELVFVEFRFGLHEPWQTMTVYSVRGGHHNETGRFIRPGHPNETVCSLAPIKFSRAEMERGCAKILGTVCGIIVKL